MTGYSSQIKACARIISQACPEPVRIGMITGTGLSQAPDGFIELFSESYERLPGFPVSTVEGHAGKLVVGTISSTPILIMQGRFHLYEGYSPKEVVIPVRVMQAIGITHLIVNNAAGGINPEFRAGDIMIIRDHINLTGQNPLVGPNNDELGLRFPDMTRVYDPRLADAAFDAANECGMFLQKGVYAGLLGPSLETPAEIKFLRTIGGDAVGLSTVMEVIAAVHARMKILGISLITNINDPDNPMETTLESVLAAAGQSVPRLNRLIAQVVRKL